MKTLITNAKVVTADKVIENGSLAFENGYITAIGVVDNADVIIDAEGKYLVPGFVDMHCHGACGVVFNDASEKDNINISAYHLSHGTTTMLASTSTALMPDLERALDVLVDGMHRGVYANIAGIFMEGPWLSTESSGAQAASLMRKPSAEDVKYLKNKYPEILRLGVAPEEPGGIDMGREGGALGILMSMAHTSATFAETEEAFANNYKLLTHFYCAMKGVERKNAYRIAGAVEAGYYLDDMFVEIIADGRHLPIELLKLIYKIKGADRIALVTDATRATGMPDGSITKNVSGTADIMVEDGVAKAMDRSHFAGSAATTDRLYRTMENAIGRDMVALSRMASLTPARLMGFSDRGELAVGKRADMILLDDSLCVKTVFLKGNAV